MKKNKSKDQKSKNSKDKPKKDDENKSEKSSKSASKSKGKDKSPSTGKDKDKSGKTPTKKESKSKKIADQSEVSSISQTPVPPAYLHFNQAIAFIIKVPLSTFAKPAKNQSVISAPSLDLITIMFLQPYLASQNLKND